MQNIIELLQTIRERPAMYIGRRSIYALGAFLSGYAFAQSQQVPRIPDPFLADFQKWIQARFSITGTQGWERIIYFYSEDGRDALDSFWSLFDEYLAQVGEQGDEPEHTRL